MLNQIIYTEKNYLKKCLSDIEYQMQWGPGKEWTNHHFQKLSHLISEKTGHTLSTSSIRRLFIGEKDFTPQPETKTILALFLGYSSWIDFKEKQRCRLLNFILKRAGLSSRRYSRILIVACGFSIIGWMVYQFFFVPPRVVCSITPRQGKAPLTLTVNYSIQDWQGREMILNFGERFNAPYKISIPHKGHVLTHTYLRSYYYEISIRSAQRVCWKDKILVISDGWEQGAFTHNPARYFEVPLKGTHESLYIPQKTLAACGIDTSKRHFTEFKNIRRFGVSADYFDLAFRLKFDPAKFTRGCYEMTLLLLGERENLRATFTTRGCSEMALLQFSDYVKKGRYSQLEGLSYDFLNFRKIHIRNRNKQVFIFIDSAEVARFAYQKAAGPLYGIHFFGLGSFQIDHIRLTDSLNTDILNDFNSFAEPALKVR